MLQGLALALSKNGRATNGPSSTVLLNCVKPPPESIFRDTALHFSCKAFPLAFIHFLKGSRFQLQQILSPLRSNADQRRKISFFEQI